MIPIKLVSINSKKGEHKKINNILTNILPAI